MNNLLRRLGAGVAAATLTATAFTASPAPALAAPAPAAATAADAAAAWMLGQRGPEGLIVGWSNTPDVGMTIDLGTSLHAVGGYQAEVASIDAAVTPYVATYTSSGAKAAAVAKVLAFRVDAGSAAVVDGLDLLGALEGMVIPSGSSRGRIDDAPGGYDSTWAQIWSVKALAAYESDETAAAVDYLVGQQCADGWFRDALPSDLDAEQTCDADADASPGLDTTAIAVTNLAPLAAENPAVANLVDKASAWLVAQQQTDGSFEDPWMGPNSNSTGLVGWALDAAGEDEAAARAAVWLRARQVAGECAPALAGDEGAIAYNDESLADAAEVGIEESGLLQWLFVGVQAIPGLRQAPAGSGALGWKSATFVRAGSTATVTATGVAPGERVCVTRGGKRQQATGPVSLEVKTPNATQKVTIALHSARGSATAELTALAKANLKVKAAKKVATAGKSNKVTVTGLVAGENVKLTHGKKRVAQGVANAKGVFKAQVAVKKAGRIKVKAVGQFGNRKGATTFRAR